MCEMLKLSMKEWLLSQRADFSVEQISIAEKKMWLTSSSFQVEIFLIFFTNWMQQL